MHFRELLALYLLVGLACAVAVYRRAPASGPRALMSAAAAVPLWPLWAPFALAGRDRPPLLHAPPPPELRPGDIGTRLYQRIERALCAAREAILHSAIDAVFTAADASKILTEVARAAARLNELDELIARHGFDADYTARHASQLEGAGAPSRSVATARLHAASVARLLSRREADLRALGELAELAELLRAQLVLARFDSPEGIDDLKRELCARVAALS